MGSINQYHRKCNSRDLFKNTPEGTRIFAKSYITSFLLLSSVIINNLFIHIDSLLKKTLSFSKEFFTLVLEEHTGKGRKAYKEMQHSSTVWIVWTVMVGRCGVLRIVKLAKFVFRFQILKERKVKIDKLNLRIQPPG